MSIPLISQTNTKLIYVGDPMCSWCYGFAPEISKVVNDLDEKLDFQLVMGGLRPYNTETMTELGSFLSHHWLEVQNRSGQDFNFEILKDSSFVYDTEPPSRAVLVMRELLPSKEFMFFKNIQGAFYKDNKNTNLVETYSEIATEFGVDPQTFKKLYESEKMKNAVRIDFETAGQLGVRSFPTVLLQKKDQTIILSRGYSKAENIKERINYHIRSDKD